MDDLDLWWRVANGAFAVLAFTMLTVRVARMWRFYSVRMRLLSMSLLLFLFTTVVGSIENITQDNPLGARTALITASCLWVVMALRAAPGYTTGERRDS